MALTQDDCGIIDSLEGSGRGLKHNMHLKSRNRLAYEAPHVPHLSIASLPSFFGER